MDIKKIALENEIRNLERTIQELTSAQGHISESYSYLDSDSVNVLMTASSLIISIANKKSEEMNKKILEKEQHHKETIKCQKTMRCYMCGEMEYGECQI